MSAPKATAIGTEVFIIHRAAAVLAEVEMMSINILGFHDFKFMNDDYCGRKYCDLL